MKIYPASYSKTYGVFISFVLILGLVFVFALRKSPIEGFVFGASIGGTFGFFVLFSGLGQRLYLGHEVLQYSSSLISVLFPKIRSKIDVVAIIEVCLGSPKFNNITTFAAINIRTIDSEITFNPDLFTKQTLSLLMKDLRARNPNIRFDDYSKSLIENLNVENIIRTKVVYSFLTIGVLIIVLGILHVLIFKITDIDQQTVIVSFTISVFLLPYVFNKLKNFFPHAQ